MNTNEHLTSAHTELRRFGEGQVLGGGEPQAVSEELETLNEEQQATSR